MKSEYFEKVKEKLQLTGNEIGLPSLECLNSISKKAMYAFHYSDLSIHCEDADETVLDWDTIFRRLVIEDFPGCCYERTEVLFQLLEHLQYEVYRLEVRCMRKEKVSPLLLGLGWFGREVVPEPPQPFPRSNAGHAASVHSNWATE